MASSSSVKIRLSRRGRKKLALYDIVVANVTSPRDGRFIEKLGTYNPNTNPATILFDEEKALKWLLNGAEPTDTVGRMLSYKGILLRKHLQIGVIKGAITQEIADARYQDWIKSKQEKIEGKVSTLAQKAQDAKSAKFAAEKVANDAKAKVVASKRNAASADLEAAAIASAKEAAGDSTEEVAEESVVEDGKVEKLPVMEAAVVEEVAVEEVAVKEVAVAEVAVADVSTPEVSVEAEAKDTPTEAVVTDASEKIAE